MEEFRMERFEDPDILPVFGKKKVTPKNVADKSCGKPGVSYSGKKKKKVSPLQKAIRIIAGTGVVVILAAAAHGITDISKKFASKIRFHRDLKVATAIVEGNITDKLLETGLATYTKDDEFVILKDNDYKKMGQLSEEELLAIRTVLNDDDEFLKVIQSTMYTTSYGTEHYYTDFTQFLNVNGYLDTETNEVSEEVWKNYVESMLVTDYRSGEITQSNGEGVYYTSNYEQPTVGRGR